MPTMDIFNLDAFSAVTLSSVVERVPTIPNFLGTLNLFERHPVRTTTVSIERRDGVISLIPTSERGAPPPVAALEKRDIRDVRIPRLAKRDSIYAHEIQNIRAFGSETELMQVQAEVAYRMMKLRRDLELTWERHRLGAVFGVVPDVTGNVIDWFSFWSISAPTPVNFALTTAGTDVRGKCHEVTRLMERAARGAWGPATYVMGLVGDAFFDSLISHPTVKETYLNWTAAAALRENMTWRSFVYGGIEFVNYRGTDDNTTVAVGTNDARFFPVNAPGVFEVALAPLESFEFVNTPGQDVYAMVVTDKDRNMWANLEIYSYPLHICTRPEMLQRGQRS